MKKQFLLLLVFLVSNLMSNGQSVGEKQRMAKLIKENFEFADSQYQVMMQSIPADKLPQSFDPKTNQVISREIQWWCTGFYPGSLFMIYEQTKNEKLKKEAERTLELIAPNQFFTDNHDLGFMMFNSFGNAYRVTKDEKYKQYIFNSAKSLATRYRPQIKSIQSWNKNQYFNCPVIMDNMMNLEMLNWASQNGGDPAFAQIANTHALTAMKTFYRPDYSSYHIVDYDLATGKIIQKRTHQGASNNSAWSRGQAWGLYGFITMYRDTKNKAYLDHAKKIAKFLINHPNMPADFVPYWDYDAPLQPLSKRDASAAAIMASALLELGHYTNGADRAAYVKAATKMIESLSSPVYRNKLGECGGFILNKSTGALPMNSEIEVPIIYADYYFLEALKRYKEWYL